MRNYELLYIIDASLSDEDKEKTVQTVKELVEKNGGVASEPDKWGMKKFAYPVNYKSEGYYCLQNFEAEDGVPAILTNKLNIDKNIVRHMIVAK